MRNKEWYTTAEVGELVGGYSDRWVRKQIELGRLKAQAFDAGSRRTLRVHRVALLEFKSTFFYDARDLPAKSDR